MTGKRTRSKSTDSPTGAEIATPANLGEFLFYVYRWMERQAQVEVSKNARFEK